MGYWVGLGCRTPAKVRAPRCGNGGPGRDSCCCRRPKRTQGKTDNFTLLCWRSAPRRTRTATGTRLGRPRSTRSSRITGKRVKCRRPEKDRPICLEHRKRLRYRADRLASLVRRWKQDRGTVRRKRPERSNARGAVISPSLGGWYCGRCWSGRLGWGCRTTSGARRCWGCRRSRNSRCSSTPLARCASRKGRCRKQDCSAQQKKCETYYHSYCLHP
jgi:hypothetical protein